MRRKQLTVNRFFFFNSLMGNYKFIIITLTDIHDTELDKREKISDQLIILASIFISIL